MRINKEIEEKNIRFKECLIKAKSNLNKTADDISDVLKRGQPNANKLKKSLSSDPKKEESDKQTSLKTSVTNENATASAVNVEENNLENNHEMNNATDAANVNGAEIADTTSDTLINKETTATEDNLNQDEKSMEISSNDI